MYFGMGFFALSWYLIVVPDNKQLLVQNHCTIYLRIGYQEEVSCKVFNFLLLVLPVDHTILFGFSKILNPLKKKMNKQTEKCITIK